MLSEVLLTCLQELVHHVVDWPGLKERFSGVPTEITYLPGPIKTLAWGFQGAQTPPRYRWFKASLETQEEESLTAEAYRITQANDIYYPPNAPDSAEILITDYLRCLREYVERGIVNEAPSLSKVPIEYTIAAPPGWSDDSRSRALKCAQNAGMALGCPQLVSEPQAAAVFQSTREGTVFAEGNTYVLCDAGGRTVDLISFIYKAPGCADGFFTVGPGNQGNCGSTSLNIRFEQFLKDTLSGSPGWSDKTLYTAMEHFEKVAKRKFSGEEDVVYSIPVPGMANNKHLNVENGFLKLHGAELRPIIGPVVDEVVSLVMRQINQTRSIVNGVILVGGFGENPFLYNSIKLRTPRSIPILRPPYTSSAVASGAVLMALLREQTGDSRET